MRTAWPAYRARAKREPLNPEQVRHKRARFRAEPKLYESRREAVETQATALIAAGLTVGALILVAVNSAGALHRIAGVVLIFLAPSIVFALLTRFVSWNWPRILGAPEEDLSVNVAATLETLRGVKESSDALALRRAALAHWTARAQSAWQLGDHKRKLLVWSILGLVPSLAFLLARGIQLVVHG